MKTNMEFYEPTLNCSSEIVPVILGCDSSPHGVILNFKAGTFHTNASTQEDETTNTFLHVGTR